MADYYPLLARAVTALERNTAETRRAMYARARTSLIDQLHSLDPPLTESEILQERTALEQAIRKIEVESARRNPIEPTPATPAEPSTQDRAPRKGLSLPLRLHRDASAERPRPPTPTRSNVEAPSKPQEGSWLTSILNKLNAQDTRSDDTAAPSEPTVVEGAGAIRDREIPPAIEIRSPRGDTAGSAKPKVDNVTTLPIARQDSIRPPPRDADAAVLRSGTVEGLPFRLYTDGSIEAEFRRGWLRFDSVEDLRLFIRSSSRPLKD